MNSCRSDRVTDSRLAVTRKLKDWEESGRELTLIIQGGLATMHVMGKLVGADELFVFCGYGMTVFLSLSDYEQVLLEEVGSVISGVHLHRHSSDSEHIVIRSRPRI